MFSPEQRALIEEIYWKYHRLSSGGWFNKALAKAAIEEAVERGRHV